MRRRSWLCWTDAQPPVPRAAAAASGFSLRRRCAVQVDLTAGTNSTLPVENLSTIKVLALNPAGTLLLSFDEVRRARRRLVATLTSPGCRTGARCS